MKPQSMVTLLQYIYEEQRQHAPGASGELSWLLSGLTLASKVISAQVRRAGLVDILGAAGKENIQGEVVQKLDLLANQALMHYLSGRGVVAVMASEEDEAPVVVSRDRVKGKYVVVFDPLDGSSNIDTCVSVGTIFSIFRRAEDPSGQRDPLEDVLQPGSEQVAAGYVVYGSSTVFVYTVGHGVSAFTLDPTIGAYVLNAENITMPSRATSYSANEANFNSFPPNYQTFLNKLRTGETGRTYSSRYIGSLVADFHRILLKGGVFLYPPTAKHKSGKLRLMYEANPIAFIAEQAGGLATNGKDRILDIRPDGLHQRTPLVVGSKEEMELFEKTTSKM